MNLKAIHSLVAVAKHGGFSPAAEALGCSKAFLSQQIRILENQYQIQLLHRTTRKVRLTSAGETFVTQCKFAFDQLEQAEFALLEEKSTLSGKIRIASLGGIFGEEYVAPSIIKFMALYPGVEVDLDFSSQQVDLLQGAYDIAIRFGKLPDSTLVARELIRYRPTLIASPEYLARYGKPIHPNDLDRHRLITGTVKQWPFRCQDESIIYTPQGRFHCGNGYVMRQAAINGLGIAHLPSLYVDVPIAKGDLVVLMPEWLEPVKPCNILFPPGRYRLRRVQLLVDFLVENIRKQHQGETNGNV